MIGFYLSGRLTDLARWEIFRLAQRRGERFRSVSDRFVLVDSGDVGFYSRVAYTKLFGRVWFSFKCLSDFRKLAEGSGLVHYVLEHQPFAVRSPLGPPLERRIGWYLDGIVDLTNPKTVVSVIPAAGRYYVIAPTYEVRASDFRQRDTKNRPFFHPTSLNARDARLIVNLSGVLPGERFLDPFCGAGGILIEAALVGADVCGLDIVEDMVLGASINLSHFGLRGTVARGDARAIPWSGFDAIATDVPYGRSSKVLTKDLRSLYLDAFESMYSALKRNRFCVVVADRLLDALLERAGFYVDHVASWYVHSDLTRRVHLCHK